MFSLKVGLRADHDGTLVREGVDRELAVVLADAGVADTTEGKVVVYRICKILKKGGIEREL